MNRKQVLEFCERQILPLLPTREQYRRDAKAQAVRLVERWRLGKPQGVSMAADVQPETGELLLNGQPAGKLYTPAVILEPVRYSEPEPRYSSTGADWEAAILARQEDD